MASPVFTYEYDPKGPKGFPYRVDIDGRVQAWFRTVREAELYTWLGMFRTHFKENPITLASLRYFLGEWLTSS